MKSLLIKVKTKKRDYSFSIEDLQEQCIESEEGIQVEFSQTFPYKIKIIPSNGEKIKSVSYLLTTNLKNYHEVFVPDSGRNYSPCKELTTLWGKHIKSRINNICMPTFILTGQDLFTDYIFGVIGKNFESDFIIREPGIDRALVAWMKKFTLEIQRGTEEYPIPQYAFESDGSYSEYLYIKVGKDFRQKETWFTTLNHFSKHFTEIMNLKPKTTNSSLMPYWCSWTDWHSDQVKEDVILKNVQEGIKIGIKNFIIDDGWFGPGLDSDWNTKLNIGDWDADPTKIPDLSALVQNIQKLNANAIIWCAPHAVSPDAKSFENRKAHLISHNNQLMVTDNGFHSLCFMCPEAREIMAEICCSLITKYDFDGAKYDLFNCVKPQPCDSTSHQHDTTSMVEGLRRTLELIDKKTRKIKNNYIVELKQNYGTPHLYEYGTIIRAGDTPYNPQGNFNRTIFNSSYTPYSLNDYQTITNYDTPDSAFAIIMKMIAAGVPSYSIDLDKLSSENKEIIKFAHNWYSRNFDILKSNRIALDPELNSWMIKSKAKAIYILLNNENRLYINHKRAQIINASSQDKIFLEMAGKYDINICVQNYKSKTIYKQKFKAVKNITLESQTGDIIDIVSN